MAAIKLILVLIAVLVTSAQPSQTYQTNPELRGILADLLELLNELQRIVINAIDVAVKSVLGLIDIVVQAAASIIGDLTTALDSVVGDLLRAINQLIEEAAEAGIDVTVCIGNSKDDIRALEVQFLLNSSSCVARKVDEAKEKIQKTIEDIESAANIITDLGDGIAACVKEPLLVQPICFVTISAKIAADIISVPLKISADVASITAYVANFVPSLKVCEVGVVAELTVAGSKIVADVTECVNGKLHV